MNRIIEGKNAIVTGANGGIGLAIVEKLAANGYNIWACIRLENDKYNVTINNISLKYNVDIRPIHIDMTDENEIKQAYEQIIHSKAKIDLLVHAAGVVNTNLFQMTSMKMMRENFEVNFFGPVFFTQLVLKNMQRNRDGVIVFISSIAGIDVNPTNCTYGSSKAAIAHFSRILASEVAGYNIRVNCVAPGPTKTRMINKVIETVGEEHIVERCALRRMAEVDEIANIVYFLASDEASFINGQVIRVDGGAR